MAYEISADEKLLDNDLSIIEGERKCLRLSRFNLREHLCGPRMRLFTALKSIISLTYSLLLMTAIINFNVIDAQLSKLSMAKHNDAAKIGGERRQYQITLWLEFLLCAIHCVTCAVTVVISFFGRRRKCLAQFVHVVWWLIFTMTVIIPIISLILYFCILPRAIQETFAQLSDAAKTDYESIIPLQEEFDCCSVEYVPDPNDPDGIQRFEPDNSNFTCAMRDMYVVKRLPPPVDDSYVIFKSQEPQKETCTAKILSHFPDKVRWVWILKASAIPHTAFGWIVIFDLLFILTVWFERGYYLAEEDDEEYKERTEDKKDDKTAKSNGPGSSEPGNNELKRMNLNLAANQIGAQPKSVADKHASEKSRANATDQEANNGRPKKRSQGVNFSFTIDQSHCNESENAALLRRRSSLPSPHGIEKQPNEGLTDRDSMGLLLPEPRRKVRTLSNISERDIDISTSGTVSKSESITETESD